MLTGRRFFLWALLALSSLGWAQPQPSNGQPKLVLTIVVDQFRYDYLTRFSTEFKGGLKELLDHGAVFTNANYEAAPTVTAVGHSTILSGAPPAFSGIAGNTWYDRGTAKNVQSITDDGAKPLGGGTTGASPRRLNVSTVGDELKLSGKGGKVFGISLKDRSAILPAGHMADGAFWFDGRSGNFVSSDYYFPALPEWAAEYDSKHPADKFAGQQFLDVHLPAAGAQLYTAIDASPFADSMVLDFALTLLAEEKLGKGPQTDLLSVSFSAVDYVGHASGPDTPRMHEMILNVDRVVGELLRVAEAQAGQGNVLVVFTADHGVSPVPEENIARKLPGGRYDGRAERAAVETALKAEFGDGTYIAANSENGFYLNPDPVPGKKIARADMERVAAGTLRQLPHIYRVYTRTELLSPGSGDRIDQRIRNGFNSARSGDVIVVHDPYWLGGGPGGTTHGSPFSYDTHVPVIFWGSQVKTGRYNRDAAVHDIAPTLATILGVATPSGSIGRVLDEILP